MTQQTGAVLTPDADVSAPTDIARHPIRRAAEASGLHPQTLREYERRGLLQPDRSDGGMRLYRDRDIVVARRVRQLTEEGVGFRAIERIVSLERRVRTLIAHARALEDQNMRLSARLTANASAHR